MFRFFGRASLTTKTAEDKTSSVNKNALQGSPVRGNPRGEPWLHPGLAGKTGHKYID